MKKNMLKKILTILDIIEIHGIAGKNLPYSIEKELMKDNITFSHQQLEYLVQYFFSHQFLHDTTRGADLAPCATIFAKSDSNSRVEALSIFECYYQNNEFRSTFHQLLTHSFHKVDLFGYFDEISYSILTQTSLFYEENDYVRLRREYIDDLERIMKEYDQPEEPFFPLSVTLCARYTSSIVAHEDTSIDYKNKSNTIVPYEHMNTILHVIPRRGVPSDRNETKALQSFYKDTLFHECEHACPICEIDIPHMLIASHIKPFRDCAHIYEAIDYNNGLLLCRNHDYLFDQGYISFTEEGKIMISKQLKDKRNLSAYVIDETYCLPHCLMSKARKLFLNYHRKHIFKG